MKFLVFNFVIFIFSCCSSLFGNEEMFIFNNYLPLGKELNIFIPKNVTEKLKIYITKDTLISNENGTFVCQENAFLRVSELYEDADGMYIMSGPGIWIKCPACGTWNLKIRSVCVRCHNNLPGGG